MPHENVNDIFGFEAKDGSRPLVAGRLINFETGKADLLDGHKSWLVDEAAKKGIAKSPNAWVNIWGHASKNWDSKFNQELSEARAAAVKKYLGEVIGSHQKIEKITTIERGMGEDDYRNDSPDPNDNAGYWRAVEVFVFGSKPKGKIRLPKKPEPKPQPVSTSYEIRVVGGFSASPFKAAQGDNYLFQIVDMIRLRTMFYHYTGGGADGGSLTPISSTLNGPPKPFSTTSPAELHQFRSPAILTHKSGVTVGPLSVGGALELRILQIFDGTRFISTNPKDLVIQGGFGFQSPGFGAHTRGILSPFTEEADFTGYSSVPKMVIDKLKEIMSGVQ